MPRLSDVPKVAKSVGVVAFAKRVWAQVTEDNLFTWAAALAYSWLFAVFPFLLFLLTLLPYLPAEWTSRAHDEVKRIVYTTAPGTDAADAIWNNIEGNLHNVLHRREGKLLPRLIGLGLALWAASGGMAMTMAALDKCYEVEQGRRFYVQRPVAIGLTLVVALLMVCVLTLLPIGTIVKHWIERYHIRYLHEGSPVLVVFDIVRWALSLFFMVTVVAVIYYKGPSILHRFVWLTPGGVFAIVVWLVLGFSFRFYVQKWGKYNETYGTVGGVVILLLFFYIDALVLLIGAEINSEVDFEVLKVRRGTRDFRKAEDLSAGAPTSI
jgi:membrane protein